MSQDNYTGKLEIYKGFIVKSDSFNENEGFRDIHLELPVKECSCPNCLRKTSRIKDYRVQIVKEMPILGDSVRVFLRKRRYVCPHCGKTFYEPNPILSKYQRCTNIFIECLFKEFNIMQSFSAIARRFGVSVPTVIRRFNTISDIGLPEPPKCISIDEFKGNAGGQKYQCNLTDPIKKRILDILPARSSESLHDYFRQFSKEEKEKVKLIVMDMSSLFRSVMSDIFPNAEIVADKYHVQRLVSWALENVRKREQKRFYQEKRRWFKRSKSLLTRREDTLNSEGKLELIRILQSSPNLMIAHGLKEAFNKIFKQTTPEAAKNQISNWLMLIDHFNLPEFKSCRTSFIRWSDPIINIIKYNVTNGFTEGTHNKIKVLKRISFGVKNFNRFRARILYLCA